MAELHTVSVPDGFEPLFLEAQAYVERYFESLVHQPEEATISIAGERYVLMRASSMSVEFVDLVMSLYRDEGAEVARGVADNLLFDLAHALGRADAAAFHEKMGVEDPIAKLSAGPVHFAFSGWAFVQIDPRSKPSADESFVLHYEHPSSFESHAWLTKGRRSDRPVCIMNAGYSSGWCEESFGIPLVATEVECVAAGGERCRFVMAPPSRIEEHLAGRDPVDAMSSSSTSRGIRVPEFFQRKRLEDQLRRANEDLEKRVEERTAELLRATEQLRLLGSAVESAVEGILVLELKLSTLDVVIRQFNEGFLRITGIPRESADGLSFAEIGLAPGVRKQLAKSLADGRAFEAEVDAERPDGSSYALEIHLMPAEKGGLASVHWIGILRDVTERRARLAALRHQATYDALTELPNRVLFYDRLEQAIIRAKRAQQPLALLVLDLDGFKEVNDTFGHETGDALLRLIGPRLREQLRASDTVARLGGDEFAILLPEIAGEIDARRIARGLIRGLQAPFDVSGQALALGGSIGIVLCPAHGVDASTLLRRADVAMYVAKYEHLGCEVYRAEEDRDSPARLALVGRLRKAIDEDELVLHYQPQIELSTGRVHRVEALVRWNHPEEGLLMPRRFIPIIEPGNLVRNLTTWVLERAITTARRWHEEGREVGVAVNLAARSLRDHALPGLVDALLQRHGLSPRALMLEVTENGLLGDPESVLPVFERFHAMGVELSIDDFGTGYSSLTHLRRLPVDEIKIDRSFVFEMLDHDHDRAIVEATIGLGRSLGRRIVAEGVENAATRDVLRDLGCDSGQGYFFSRPLEASAFEEWMDAR